jgi:hypothetical protein
MPPLRYKTNPPAILQTIPLPAKKKVVLPMSLYCRYQEQAGSMDPQLLIPTRAIWKQRCRIVKIPRDMDPKPNGPYEDVYLIDIQTSQMFGMYSRPK